MRRDASVCRPRSETMTKGAGRSTCRAGDESDRLSPGKDMLGPHPDPALLLGGFALLLGGGQVLEDHQKELICKNDSARVIRLQGKGVFGGI